MRRYKVIYAMGGKLFYRIVKTTRTLAQVRWDYLGWVMDVYEVNEVGAVI
jgi:hypothetical protein